MGNDRLICDHDQRYRTAEMPTIFQNNAASIEDKKFIKEQYRMLPWDTQNRKLTQNTVAEFIDPVREIKPASSGVKVGANAGYQYNPTLTPPPLTPL